MEYVKTDANIFKVSGIFVEYFTLDFGTFSKETGTASCFWINCATSKDNRIIR